MKQQIVQAYAQDPYRVKVEWGNVGTRQAALRGDLIVIIDTIDYSTAVTTAVARGASIIPARDMKHAEKLATEKRAKLAVEKIDARHHGGFSLSASTMERASEGDRIVLASPNGATDSRQSKPGCVTIVGALVNASAVAHMVTQVLRLTSRNCTICPAGELWPGETQFRPSIEDYLAASAIINKINCSDYLSPEAQVCACAWNMLEHRYAALILDGGSARKVREEGFGDDAEYACRLDLYDVVPVYVQGEFKQQAYDCVVAA